MRILKYMYHDRQHCLIHTSMLPKKKKKIIYVLFFFFLRKTAYINSLKSLYANHTKDNKYDNHTKAIKQLMFHTPKFKLNVVPNVNLKTKEEDFPE